MKQKNHKKIINFFSKKGSRFFLLPFFILVFSCANIDPNKYGKVTLHNTADSESFIFSVNDEFVDNIKNNKMDKKNPQITAAEAQLLILLLKEKKYCLNNYGTPLFVITSKQEKIYDMTFAHLIEQNYRARPLTPRMYFGRCGVAKR